MCKHLFFPSSFKILLKKSQSHDTLGFILRFKCLFFHIYIFCENIATLVFLTHVSVFFFSSFFLLTCRLAGNSSSQNETLTRTKVISVQISAEKENVAFYESGRKQVARKNENKIVAKKKKNPKQLQRMNKHVVSMRS